MRNLFLLTALFFLFGFSGASFINTGSQSPDALAALVASAGQKEKDWQKDAFEKPDITLIQGAYLDNCDISEEEERRYGLRFSAASKLLFSGLFSGIYSSRLYEQALIAFEHSSFYTRANTYEILCHRQVWFQVFRI